MIRFKCKRKKFSDELSMKLSGKGIYPNARVTYLGIKIDENLACQFVTTTC